MKKILMTLALVASISFAYAQPGGGMGGPGGGPRGMGGPGGPGGGPARALEAKRAAVTAAEAAAAKKANVANLIKLGAAYVAAYDAPAGNAWIGAGRPELSVVMGNARPLSTEQVEIQGVQLTKEDYGTHNFYFNGDRLAIIEVTRPVVPDALGKAIEAYQKAAALDTKGSKKKDLDKAFSSISDKLSDEAFNLYNLGKGSEASRLFERSADVSALAGQLDTSAYYNAGFVAHSAGDLPRAQQMFEKCLSYNFFGEGGEVYAKLANIAEKSDPAKAKQYLETGFAKFPDSQSILIGLINYYIENYEDTGKLFDLINQAKANEPNNASLYYVEGNINVQLGNEDAAIAAYRKCADINPNYEFGYVGEGVYWYNKAVDLQDKAQQELDDAKYAALVSEFEAALKNCITPFEKAFEVTKDDNVKVSVAEYLKNANYRFRDEDSKYMDAYNKYDAIVRGE